MPLKLASITSAAQWLPSPARSVMVMRASGNEARIRASMSRASIAMTGFLIVMLGNVRRRAGGRKTPINPICLAAPRQPLIPQHAKQHQIHGAPQDRPIPMPAQAPFQRKARPLVNPLRARVFRTGIQPQPLGLQLLEGKIDHIVQKLPPRARTGLRQRQPPQLDPPRRITDFTIKRKTGGLSVLLPDQQPVRRIGQMRGQRPPPPPRPPARPPPPPRAPPPPRPPPPPPPRGNPRGGWGAKRAGSVRALS